MENNNSIALVSNYKVLFDDLKDEFNNLGFETIFFDENSVKGSSYFFDIKKIDQFNLLIFSGLNKIPAQLFDLIKDKNISIINNTGFDILQEKRVKIHNLNIPETLLIENVLNSFNLLPIESINASLFVPVSFYGDEGVRELTSQTISLFNQGIMEYEVFPKRIAYNIIPAVGFVDNNNQNGVISKLDSIVSNELSRTSFLKNTKLNINSICVPVVAGSSAVITVSFKNNIELNTIKEALKFNSKVYLNDGIEYITCVDTGFEYVNVSMLKKHSSNTISMYAVADNISVLRVKPIIELVKTIL